MEAEAIVIEGRSIHDIASFYDEINRLFMAGEDWEVGTLDGLNDILYGRNGATIIWRDAASSREALGVETTRQYYLNKLANPDLYNISLAQQSLDALAIGDGPTYFDIVLEIFSEHPDIHLLLQ